MQVSGHDRLMRYTFQAGHEGSIPFARSGSSPSQNLGRLTIGRYQDTRLPRRARCPDVGPYPP